MTSAVAATHFALMCALKVVAVQPFIQISLQRVDAVVELLTERDLVDVNGGVKVGQRGGAILGQFGAGALERAALK